MDTAAPVSNSMSTGLPSNETDTLIGLSFLTVFMPFIVYSVICLTSDLPGFLEGGLCCLLGVDLHAFCIWPCLPQR